MRSSASSLSPWPIKIMACEEKIQNGKLVSIEIWAEAGPNGVYVVTKLKITGDFFLHPEDAINSLEKSLIGVPLSIQNDELAGKITLALGSSQLIGVSCEDLARMFKKAVS